METVLSTKNELIKLLADVSDSNLVQNIDQILEKEFSKADKNHDDKISFDEFVQYYNELRAQEMKVALKYEVDVGASHRRSWVIPHRRVSRAASISCIDLGLNLEEFDFGNASEVREAKMSEQNKKREQTT